MNNLSKSTLLLIGLLLILCTTAAARPMTGNIALLAVQEETNQGSVADLTLELQSGKGRVFIETFPLTKVDTQISTRFAKDVACSILEKDCSKYDFIYTINSDSYIIGGPSAGAAITILTMALLEGEQPDAKVAMTGTINSGGFIGPVSGIKAKIQAANDNHLEKVLIPSGTRYHKENITSQSLDLVAFGNEIGIEVIEVGDIVDALAHYTPINNSNGNYEIILDDQYSKVMENLADKLCSRAQGLQNKFLESHTKVEISPDMTERELQIINLTTRADKAQGEGSYYSAASYCFGANYQYRRLILELQNLTSEQIQERAQELHFTFTDLSREIDYKPLTTLTDVQSYLIVKLRVDEAITELEEILEQNSSSTDQLAYAMERGYSALSWATFFDTGSTRAKLDPEVVEISCVKKISEAEERLQYARIYLPNSAQDAADEIKEAKYYQRNGSFALCLFTASKAKAGANVVLNNLGVQEDQLQTVIKDKLAIVQKSLHREIQKGIFPILGYSYYEYANSLSTQDPYSSLIYIEYAAELSNFNMYFNTKNSLTGRFMTRNELKNLKNSYIGSFLVKYQNNIVLFTAGLAAGLFLAAGIVNFKLINTSKKKKKKYKKVNRKQVKDK